MTEQHGQKAPSPSRADFEKVLINKACTDADFRLRLRADPKAAIRETFGVEVPPDVQIEVLEETPSKFYLVLPPQTDELTDEQLAAVAGGVGGSTLAMKEQMVASKIWSPSVAAGNPLTFK
jgi:hypothetical protein